MKKIKKRDSWSNQYSFILAITGAATGLGNIWKFPYMVGENGGGNFFFIYIISIVIIGFPLMIGEIMIGRITKSNPIDALQSLANPLKYNWKILGWWGIIGLSITLSFYSVISGWSLFYLFQSFFGTFIKLSPNQIIDYCQNFLSKVNLLLLYHSIFLFFTIFIVSKGIKNGIEKINNVMMIFLFLTLFFITCFACIKTKFGFSEAIHYLFNLNFSKINIHIIMNALGHAFFTLSIGAGAMLIYGSYLPSNISIIKTSCISIFLDIMIAVFSGLSIFSILFLYNISPKQGPELMFVALPIIFTKISFGRWIGIFFFILLSLSALTSSINIAETLIASLYEKTKLNKIQASLIIAIIIWLMGIISIFSFNVWKNFTFLGKKTLFAFITDLSTNIFLPIGGILYAFYIGWIIKKSTSEKELSFKYKISYLIWYFLIRFIVPFGIFFIFISSLFSF